MHKATASLIHHPGSADWKGKGIDMEREGVGVRDSWLSGALNGLVRAREKCSGSARWESAEVATWKGWAINRIRL